MSDYFKCRAINPDIPCTPDMECYINSPKFYNCFLVYKYFIRDNEHTLQEVATLMGISHTTVKQIESQALKKLKEQVNKGNINLRDFIQIIKPKD